jgi:hypothetical protein
MISNKFINIKIRLTPEYIVKLHFLIDNVQLIREENLPTTLPFYSRKCGPKDHTSGIIKRWGLVGKIPLPPKSLYIII